MPTTQTRFNCVRCFRCHQTFDRCDLVEVTRRFSPTLLCCPSCADLYTGTCNCCDASVLKTELITHQGQTFCEECFYGMYTRCYRCSVPMLRNESLDGYCPSCRRALANFTPKDFVATHNCYARIGSNRCYGLELESDRCDDHDELRGKYSWGAKNDCSINGKEFYSGILKGDLGLAEIEKFLAEAKKRRWVADHKCGFHLHLDMRDESEERLYAIALAYRLCENFWFSLVKPERRYNEYCEESYWTVDDLKRAKAGLRFETFARDCDRTWFNPDAYTCHQTFEIRHHHGTFDPLEVTNWVMAHVRFADWASDHGFSLVDQTFSGLNADKQFQFIKEAIWQDDILSEFYTKKREKLDYER